MLYRSIGLIAFFVALCVTKPAFAGQAEDGDAAFKNNDYQTALKLLMPLAEKGDITGEMDIGLMYFAGRGVKLDRCEAAKWFWPAAQQGNAGAEVDLGIIYATGACPPKDYMHAYLWFNQASSQGVQAAKEYRDHVAAEMSTLQALETQLLLGTWKPVEAETLKSALKAAEGGSPEAEENLGNMYRDGIGVNRDYGAALQWYRKAADQGFAEAQVLTGYIYLQGQGVESDPTEALKWFRKAADQGSAFGENAVGYAYAKGSGVTQDYTEAIKWLRKAAEKGYEVAQDNLASFLLSGRGTEPNPAEAVLWLKKSAEQGNMEAQFHLADSYARGIGGQKDGVQAYKWAVLSGRTREDGQKLASYLETTLTKDEVSEGNRLAAQWRPVSNPLLPSCEASCTSGNNVVEGSEHGKAP